MYLSAILFGGPLALSALPSAFAASCEAIGWLDTNVGGGGVGGGFATGSQGIKVYRNDELITTYEPGVDDPVVCSDLVSFASKNLDDTFSWGASCDTVHFTECHGAYHDQTHIDGDSPENGSDFYGVGSSSSSECRVQFDCED